MLLDQPVDWFFLYIKCISLSVYRGNNFAFYLLKVLNHVAVVPCFYIYLQKAQFPSDINVACSSYSSLSSEGTVSSPKDNDDEEKWEGENYEYDRALGADRTYLKFKKHLDSFPDQCLR